MALGVPWALPSVPPGMQSCSSASRRGPHWVPITPRLWYPPTAYPSPGASLLASASCRGRGWDGEGYLEAGLPVLDGEGWDAMSPLSPPNPALPSAQVSPAAPASLRRS